MDWPMALTIIVSVLVPVLAAFGFMIGWLREIDKKLGALDSRMSRMEGENDISKHVMLTIVGKDREDRK